MVKRNAPSGLDHSVAQPTGQSPFSMETMLTSSLRRRLSSPSPGDKHSDSKPTEKVSKAREALCKQIDSCKDTLTANLVCTVAQQQPFFYNFIYQAIFNNTISSHIFYTCIYVYI